ncbi:MAG TPA: hypothetical protein VGF94_13710 [Kofleriaceae bacterium]
MTPWPFDRDGGGLLALYVVTLALHAVFVSYVVGGSAYALVQALRRRDDPFAAVVRDRLPFMLGCGITAGVAPLLFVQLLHQRRFYTANLLLGPRWLAVVPALIAGFYALYLAKQSARWRRAALAAALACFAFVAWSWSELHELMLADAEWRAFYAAGERVFGAATIAPRFVVLAGAMAVLFATVAAWSAETEQRRMLAAIALGARAASAAGGLWLWHAGFAVEGAARAWLAVLAAAFAVEVGAWLAVRWRGSTRALVVATAAGAGALVAAVIVREAPRVALIESPRALAAHAGGEVAFALALVLGIAAIVWVVRLTRR